MKEFKVFQIVYNKMNVHEDYIDEGYVYSNQTDDLVNLGIRYFQQDFDKLHYPAKSYSVAIIYAFLLNRNFQEDFYQSLGERDLFCGNDRFFVPYYEAKEVYGAIIDGIGLFSGHFELNMDVEQVAKTVGFFKKEFGLDGG